jgi:hypothetical protein
MTDKEHILELCETVKLMVLVIKGLAEQIEDQGVKIDELIESVANISTPGVDFEVYDE